jgi:hypothetical protein
MTVEHQLRIILQTGQFTSPNPLLRDLETIAGIKLDVRHLGTSLRGGGSVAFIIVTTDYANLATLAGILHRHTKRLDSRGGDDLFILLGCEIDTNEEMINFRNIRCQRPLSLKNMPIDEIMGVLEKEG